MKRKLDEVDKSDIARLPPFECTRNIIVARTLGQADRAMSSIRSHVVGFDTETKPVFTKGAPREPVAIVQIATDDIVVIFHVGIYGLPRGLRDLLQNPLILKVGVGAERDAVELAEWHELTPAGIVDIDVLVRRRYPHLKRCGLRGALASCAGFSLPKPRKLTTANWARVPLTPPMVQYAAKDAAAGLFLYNIIVRDDNVKKKKARRV